jgi:hypothetical protein
MAVHGDEACFAFREIRVAASRRGKIKGKIAVPARRSGARERDGEDYGG